jgi:hypothetical protein
MALLLTRCCSGLPGCCADISVIATEAVSQEEVPSVLDQFKDLVRINKSCLEGGLVDCSCWLLALLVTAVVVVSAEEESRQEGMEELEGTGKEKQNMQNKS